MLEQRLQQYEQQHESLEHDAIAASATGSEDAQEAVVKIREQQEHIRLAHEAITAEMRKEKDRPKPERMAVPKNQRKIKDMPQA